jgi:hypothetical protein
LFRIDIGLRMFHLSASLVELLAGLIEVDFTPGLGVFGEDANVVFEDLEEPAVDCEHMLLPMCGVSQNTRAEHTE